ncbi:MAG: NAD(P)/FAD-dependent oxidoreductase [Prevotella ruminicola]|uniref:NAD(P)/FAD-dependent oxidoreductase n=1 Tax=Xylanibacter ruminicola TaxID=839 RepID=A0A9D5SAI7_XYLRU|nr:NAD(P)/FAD-dependent oxidoreductase [Xylanibacter ruminicola]
MKTAIVGGGAAGFFLAVNLKEMCPDMDITIFEKSKKVLAKVEVSGGGRCNCTNSFEGVSDLSQVYPRGHRLLKRLFKIFNYHDAYQWFEDHGVRLVTQEDHCVFPMSQDAHTIINLFLAEARRHGIEIRTQQKIESLEELKDFDFKVITTGGMPSAFSLLTSSIIPPVPSLFTFSIDDEALRSLMGTVVEAATASIPGTKFRSTGPLLITHWGMSGPAILKLSSHAARELHDHHYQMPLAINWPSLKEPDIQQELRSIMAQHPQKQIATIRPFGLPSRLWDYLVQKTLGERAQNRWQNLNQKELNRLTNALCNDQYQIAGRSVFKDEFVTCGGIDLASVNPNTLESKNLPSVYFAGEVLDIDGVTGGFNFQAAWTTAYTVACAISKAAPAPQ